MESIVSGKFYGIWVLTVNCVGRMLDIVAAAVKNTAWQETDGIIKEGSDNASNSDGIGFKGAFPSFFLLWHILIYVV